MPQGLNVLIITAQCSKARSRMGIRLEEKSHQLWVADWAFKIKEHVAIKEGYDKTRVDGQFVFSAEFPGCPYCESKSFVLCDCKNLICYETMSTSFKCPKCGLSGTVGNGPVTSLWANQDC